MASVSHVSGPPGKLAGRSASSSTSTPQRGVGRSHRRGSRAAPVSRPSRWRARPPGMLRRALERLPAQRGHAAARWALPAGLVRQEVL